MLSAALFLLANSLFLTLRLTGSSGSFPKPLSAREEQMYLERSLAGDLEARNILVEHNLRLVAHIIKKYYTQSAEQEDLISIGTIGLIKAVDTFRPDRKIRLATYASRCVENEVLMYFRSRKKLQGEVSLSDSIDSDAAGNALCLLDVVGSDDTMLSDMADREEQVRIRQLVDTCLTEREAEVIRRRYGLSGRLPQTQRQVAAAFGISRSYVSRRRYCKRWPKCRPQKLLPHDRIGGFFSPEGAGKAAAVSGSRFVGRPIIYQPLCFFRPMTAVQIAAQPLASSRASHSMLPLSPVLGSSGSLAVTVSAWVISFSAAASL